MTTQAQIRRAFWENFPEFAEHKNKRQNDCPAEIRAAFVDFVDSLARAGEISEKLADKVTL